MTRQTSWLIVGLHAIFCLAVVGRVSAQSPGNEELPYQKIAKAITDAALQDGKAYAMLEELCLHVGARLSGSPQAAAAVEWGRQTMLATGLENVHLQPVMVPHWDRGEVEAAAVINSPTVGTRPLRVCALGGSIATPPMGLVAEVVEVHNFAEVKALGKKAAGKIIFFNRPMDPRQRNTFSAYGGAVDQRGNGAIEAAKVGGVAALVRSMTTLHDDTPHTGMMHYQEGVPKVPSAAISTNDADFLSALLRRDGQVRVQLQLDCQTLPDAPSANVIGEIVGSEKPEEVIVLGGHLDSWDKGQGAHDDGAGCVQSIEALRLLKLSGLQPKRTVRAVLFINEENGSRGGEAYADSVAKRGPKHIAAIESDRGGFTPRGFTIAADRAVVDRLAKWAYLFASFGADAIRGGGGGADIAPLTKNGTLGIGLMVDSQRYFDYHHSDNDTIDKVNGRELELGAAAMAIYAYVLANEGI